MPLSASVKETDKATSPLGDIRDQIRQDAARGGREQYQTDHELRCGRKQDGQQDAARRHQHQHADEPKDERAAARQYGREVAGFEAEADGEHDEP